jgi:hypothetical protein
VSKDFHVGERMPLDLDCSYAGHTWKLQNAVCAWTLVPCEKNQLVSTKAVKACWGDERGTLGITRGDGDYFMSYGWYMYLRIPRVGG